MYHKVATSHSTFASRTLNNCILTQKNTIEIHSQNWAFFEKMLLLHRLTLYNAHQQSDRERSFGSIWNKPGIRHLADSSQFRNRQISRNKRTLDEECPLSISAYVAGRMGMRI